MLMLLSVVVAGTSAIVICGGVVSGGATIVHE
jgi:hypothetical protein